MLRFRLLTGNDEKQLTKVYSETILTEFPEYSEKIRRYFTNKKYRQEMFELPTKLGAFLGSEMIGYLIAHGPHGGIAYIYWLAILPEYQNQGIGTKFLKAFEEWCKKVGVHVVQLQSDPRNVEFYKKRGYAILGFDEKGYFGVDNYIMKKALQEPKEENFLK